MSEQNAYAILHIRKGASIQEIKNAWITMVKLYPPEGETETMFMALQKAYDTLRDPIKRAREDVFTLNYPNGQFIFSGDAKTTEELSVVEEKAKSKLEESKADPKNDDLKEESIRLLNQLAYKYAVIKKWRPAIDCWHNVLEIDPTHQKAKHNYIFAHIYVAYFYALHKLYDEAIALYQVALEMLPDSLDVIQNIAILYDKLNQPDKSAVYWSDVETRWRNRLNENPDDEYLKESLATLHMFHGARLTSKVQDDTSKGEAIIQYRKVLELNPENFDARLKICNTLMEERQYEEAANELKILSQKHPNEPEVPNLLGWAYLNLGKVELAFSTWRRALVKNPKDDSLQHSVYRAHLEIGKKYKSTGMYTQALVHFKELQKINPNDPSIINEIGETLMRKGDKRSAMAAFQRVLQLDSKNKDAKKFLNEIRIRG